jgi:HEAT repeat protein
MVLLFVCQAGCSSKSEPVLSHGKPVAYWLEQMKQPDARARKKAVTALGHVGNADRAVLPALIAAVKDKHAHVRDEAVVALLNMGPGAGEAVPVLQDALRDQDATVRAHAAKAIARIQGG